MQPDWEDQEDPGDKQHKNGTTQTQPHSMTKKTHGKHFAFVGKFQETLSVSHTAIFGDAHRQTQIIVGLTRYSVLLFGN